MVLLIYHIFHILDIMAKQEVKEKDTKKWIFEIDTKLDEDFRVAIGKNKGTRRGVIKEALEEAIKDWIEKPNK